MAPSGPQPSYDFMLKNNAPARGTRFSLPKPLAIAIVAVAVFFLLIVIYALVFGGKASSTQPIVSAAARATEIARVSTEVGQASQDAGTDSLASTVTATLTSDQNQLSSYLKSAGKKVSQAALAVDQDKNVDSQVQTALQNNNLNQYYTAYLKTNLATYRSDLQAAYTKGTAKSRPILKDAYDSAGVILSSLGP